MLFDFYLSSQVLGTSKGEVRQLDPYHLCDDPRGLTGTEVTALGLAEALMRQGHHVRLLSHWKALRVVREGEGGMDFLDLHAWLGPPDVAVAFHDATPLARTQAALKVVWHQTLTPPHSELMGKEDVDLYLSSTGVNARHLKQYTGDKSWGVVPNGWDYGAYVQPREAVPGRLFYHTSPERGLHILLRALPSIRARVPEAHLVVWCRMETVNTHTAIATEIRERLIQCAGFVEVHGRGGSRNEVLASLATASCLAYPSEPNIECEVMPLSVMEACAYGVPVVTAPSSSFERAFGMALDVCPSPPSKHLSYFVERVCEVLRSSKRTEVLHFRGRRWAMKHTFTRTAERFLALVTHERERKKIFQQTTEESYV